MDERLIDTQRYNLNGKMCMEYSLSLLLVGICARNFNSTEQIGDIMIYLGVANTCLMASLRALTHIDSRKFNYEYK